MKHSHTFLPASISAAFDLISYKNQVKFQYTYLQTAETTDSHNLAENLEMLSPQATALVRQKLDFYNQMSIN